MHVLVIPEIPGRLPSIFPRNMHENVLQQQIFACIPIERIFLNWRMLLDRAALLVSARKISLVFK